MQIQTVHYLFNVHHLRLVDFCDTNVMFGSDGEPSLKDKAEIDTRSKHRCLSAQSKLCDAFSRLKLCKVLAFGMNPH